jgi:hypothetical protein
MALKLSTGLRNNMLVTAPFKGSMDTCVMKLYAGAVPVSADSDCTANTLLCTIYNGNDGVTTLSFATTALGGEVTKTISESWAGTNALSGTATFYRLELAADDQTLSTTQLRVQGNIGTSGAELNLTSTALTLNSTQNIDYYSIALPTL